MSHALSPRKPVVDWLTVVSIAAIAISFNVAFHEGAHALTCLAVGSTLQEYSALYVSCDSPTVAQEKMVAGSAPIYNLLAGVLLWIVARNVRREQAPETRLFLWLFMSMNWFYGAGYWIFSGIADVGDMAVVISGWEPGWLWRILLIVLGLLICMFFGRLALREFARIVGGGADEQIRRATKLCVVSYITSFVVILIAGLFCPQGLSSLPATAGMFAVAGALSPFLWMMRLLRTEGAVIPVKKPLEIHRRSQWLVAALIVVFTYVFVLGRTLYF